MRQIAKTNSCKILQKKLLLGKGRSIRLSLFLAHILPRLGFTLFFHSHFEENASLEAAIVAEVHWLRDETRKG
jgi:hypothetical protein